jgi:uncharacterized protein (TIGR03437 family)
MKFNVPGLIIFLLTVAAQVSAQQPEYRAFWIETFNTSINNHADVVSIINNVRLANCNAVFVQVRRRGDSWYLNSLEPPADRVAITPGFDPLADLITEAHANGIEVHAFVIIGAIWNSDPTTRPPENPNHVFNKHGYNQAAGKLYEGRDNWLTRTLLPDSGSTISFNGQRFSGEFWIDLGHPDAAQYTHDVLMHLVRNYDLDGLHLDRIRYPELSGSAASGASIGYNQISVERFNKRYGIIAGTQPAQNDPRWNRWRRDQVTNVVRRIYLNAMAAKPKLRISAALIAFYPGPVTEADWQLTDAYWRVFQDWNSWTAEGILDMPMPMIYRREHQTSPNLAADLDTWVEWTKNHQYGRNALIGLGVYLNSIEATLRQIRRTRNPSNQSKSASGFAFYSYANTNEAVNANPFSLPAGQNTPKRSFAEFASGLVKGKSIDGTQNYEDPGGNPSPVFAQPVPIPEIASKSLPIGHVMGVVKDRNGVAYDSIDLTIARIADGTTPTAGRTSITTNTDGNGFFGAVGLAPGNYRISVTPTGEQAFEPFCSVPVIEGQVISFDIIIDRGPFQLIPVSAASFCGPILAPGSIVATFGAGIATSTQSAEITPLPTTIAGTSVKVKDSSGIERPAPLFFVSPQQVNFQMPAESSAGAASITTISPIVNRNVNVMVSPVAPGIFSANSNGIGVAAAVVLRVKPDGAQSVESVSTYDGLLMRHIPVQIALGPESDEVFLLLFGTGIRGRSSELNVKAVTGGLKSEVTFAGAHEIYVGLDQINVKLNKALAGKGLIDVVLIVDGYATNTVQIDIK